MGRSRTLIALSTAILVPSLALVVLGLRSLRDETERAATRWREQALAVVDSVQKDLDARVAALARGDDRELGVRFAADGSWLGDGTGEAPAAAAFRDPLLARALGDDVDRLQVSGQIDQAAARLRQAVDASDDPELAAWALEAQAALFERAGRAEDAQRAWSELVERFPEARDARGLRRSFAARFATWRTRGFDELLDLYGDLIDDHARLDDVATAVLKGRVSETLDAEFSGFEGTPPRERLAELRARDRERERTRDLLALLPLGLSQWIADGAPGGSRVFDLPADPLVAEESPRRMLVALQRDSDGTWRGGAQNALTPLVQAVGTPAFDTWKALSFAAEIRDDAGRELAQSDPAAAQGAPLAERALAAPYATCTLAVRGADFEGFLGRERKRFWWTALALAAALAVALGGAVATFRAVAREVEAARARESFVAAVTHELKAPLAAIRLFGELLEKGDVEPAKVREFAERTVRETDRLGRLVDSVLELARLEHGSASARASERVDLAELARRAIDGFAPIARERGFSIELSAPDGALLVRGDRDALEGALVNLLDNAVKHAAAPHAIQVEVARTRPGFVALAVLDRGRGVPADQAERIFAPFARLGDELVRETPGVGLGLALVRRIAQAHGGTASVAPREGGGSRFAIELPEDAA